MRRPTNPPKRGKPSLLSRLIMPPRDTRLHPVRRHDGTVEWVLPPRRPIGVVALARTCRRLTWRYRAQLLPIAVIVIVWALGPLVAATDEGVVTVLTLGGLAVAGVGVTATKLLDRPSRRLYAVIAASGAVVWLAITARIGAGTPMPAVLWLAGCALAAPWWWHHRIRCVPTVGATSPNEAEVWSERIGAANGPLPGSTLTNLVRSRGGWSATVQLVPGKHTTDDAVGKTTQITSAFDRTSGSVVVEPTADGSASRASLLVLDRNPLHQVQPWPGPSAFNTTSGLATIGVHADGTTAPYRFYRLGSGSVHDLIAGTTDSGKSRLLDQLLAAERHSGLAVSWVIDPQRGQSLPDWVDGVDWFAVSVEEGVRMLRAARDVMYARNAHLARIEWIDEQGRKRRGKGFFDPSPDMPLLSVTIEEAHRVLAVPEAKQMAEEIAIMSRKCGIKLRLVVQVPLLDQLGGSATLRDMVASGNVIVLRTAGRMTGQVAFQGSLPVEPNKLPRQFPDGSSTAGLGFILGPSDRPATMRTYYLDDPYHSATSGTPAELDVLSLNAAGQDYASRGESADGEDRGSREMPAEKPAIPRSQLSDVPEPRQPTDAKEAVLAVLAERGETQRGQLIAATGYSPRAVTDACKALVDDQRIRKTNHGRYALTHPDPGHTV